MSGMSTEGLRLLIILVGVLGVAEGCAGVPPAPSHANTRPDDAPSTSDEGYADDDDGWLFDWVTGRRTSASREKASPQVVPVSATESVSPLPAIGAAAFDASAVAESETEEESGFEWSDLEPESVVANIKKAAGYGPNEDLARASYKKGKQLFDEKNYARAVAPLKTAYKRWPDSLLEEDALFLLAESYFFADQYAKAQDVYENLLKKHTNSRHLDTVGKRLFSIGQYWEKLHEDDPHWPVTPNLTDKERPLFDTFGNALKAYETIRLNDPTGPLADDSIMATANAYFRKGRFEDAAYHYDVLRKEYPKSEHQTKAHLLGMQSKLRMYQGAKYDRTPLNEADQIAEQTLTQFRSELGAEAKRVAAERDRIIEQQAERDWVMAQYYEKRKQFRAARYYYQSLIGDYPLTQYAQRARARLEQIRDEPDTPSNRFQWLTDMFPSEE